MTDDLMSPVLGGAGTVEYEWMTWPEIAAAAAADAPVVIAVGGSTEQHGPHLPVSADWVIPQALLRLAAAKRPFVVGGPSLRLGYRSRPASGGGQHFPGTLSLRATTFIAMIEDLLEELIRTGFRRIVLYSWHFENTNFVYEPAYLVSGRFPPGVKIVVVENAMPEFDAADLEVLFPPDGFPPDSRSSMPRSSRPHCSNISARPRCGWTASSTTRRPVTCRGTCCRSTRRCRPPPAYSPRQHRPVSPRANC